MQHQINTDQLLQKWLKTNLTVQQVMAEVEKLGLEQGTADEIVNAFKKLRLNERTKRGLRLLVIGCFLGFVSCVLTVMGVLPEFKGFILYGLTSIGITLALLGGYYVFE